MQADAHVTPRHHMIQDYFITPTRSYAGYSDEQANCLSIPVSSKVQMSQHFLVYMKYDMIFICENF